MPYFGFHQNNSGGSFVFDAKAGISTEVWIEAATLDDAIHRAKGIGLYFDGRGDCPCCGNRWYEYAEETPTPPATSDFSPEYAERVGAAGGYVHYLNGRIVPLPCFEGT